MLKTGDIIYFDKLYFARKKLDRKKNRPCVVLFSELDKDQKEHVYFCKLTTSQHNFNKHNNTLQLLTKPVYNTKLSFADISTVYHCINDDNLHSTDINLKEDAFLIIKRISKTYKENRDVDNKDDVKEILCYMDSFVKPIELPVLKKKKKFYV